MVRNQAYRVVSTVFLILWLSVANLSASTATVFVSATILPWIEISVSQHKTNYNILQSDMDRHYIDIPLSATVEVDTNVSTVHLTFSAESSDDILARVNGQGLFGRTLEIALTASEIYSRRVTRNIDFRVLLDKESQIGAHMLAPWISVQGY